MGVATEAFEEAIELGMQHGVVRDGLFEFLELRRLGQFPMQQQVADLEEARLFSQLAADRITAVQQHAGVAVDIRDLALAGRGRGKARIVGEGVGLGIQLADIDNVRSDRSALNWQVYRLVAKS